MEYGIPGIMGNNQEKKCLHNYVEKVKYIEKVKDVECEEKVKIFPIQGSRQTVKGETSAFSGSTSVKLLTLFGN